MINFKSPLLLGFLGLLTASAPTAFARPTPKKISANYFQNWKDPAKPNIVLNLQNYAEVFGTLQYALPASPKWLTGSNWPYNLGGLNAREAAHREFTTRIEEVHQKPLHTHRACLGMGDDCEKIAQNIRLKYSTPPEALPRPELSPLELLTRLETEKGRPVPENFKDLIRQGAGRYEWWSGYCFNSYLLEAYFPGIPGDLEFQGNPITPHQAEGLLYYLFYQWSPGWFQYGQLSKLSVKATPETKRSKQEDDPHPIVVMALLSQLHAKASDLYTVGVDSQNNELVLYSPIHNYKATILDSLAPSEWESTYENLRLSISKDSKISEGTVKIVRLNLYLKMTDDTELDSNFLVEIGGGGNLLGAEWESHSHPDLVFVASKDKKLLGETPAAYAKWPPLKQEIFDWAQKNAKAQP